MNEETETIEYKKTTRELREAMVSISAILNKHRSGKIYFGIKDDGTPIGLDISAKTLRDVSQTIAEKIEPKIYPIIEKVSIDGKNCIEVKFSGNNIPYFAEGKAYMRVSDTDRQLSASELGNLYIEAMSDDEKWDAQVSDKTIEDVNEEVLKKFISRGVKAKRIPFEYTNKEEVLNRLGLIKDNKLLNAGKVLFCDNNNVELQLAVFATETKTTFIDIDKREGNIFSLMDYAYEYIMHNIIWNVKIEKKRIETPEIPINSIREALANSYAHKSFVERKGVEVSIFTDRVEIYNPGTFPTEFTPQDYIDGKAHSVFRNPIIAQTLYKSEDAESFSSGIRRIYEECKSNNVDVQFRAENTGFTIIFHRNSFEKLRKPIIENDKDVGINVGINVGIKLSPTKEKILEEISNNKEITQTELASKLKITERTIQRNIQEMKNDKVLSRIGSRKNGYWKILK